MKISVRSLSVLVLGSTLLTSCTGQDSKKKRNARPVAASAQPQRPQQPQQPVQPTVTPPGSTPAPPPPAEPNMTDNGSDTSSPPPPPVAAQPNKDLGKFENAEPKANLKNLVSVNLFINSEKMELLLVTKTDAEPLLERLEYAGQLLPKADYAAFNTLSEKNKTTRAEARCLSSCERILVRLKKPGIGDMYLAFEGIKQESGWAHLAFMPGLTETVETKAALAHSHVNEEALALSDSLDSSSGIASGILIEFKTWVDEINRVGSQDAEVIAIIDELKKMIGSLELAIKEMNSSVEDLDAIWRGGPLDSMRGTPNKLGRASQALESGLAALNSQSALISDKYLRERAPRVRLMTQDLAKVLAVVKNAFERLPSLTRIN